MQDATEVLLQYTHKTSLRLHKKPILSPFYERSSLKE